MIKCGFIRFSNFTRLISITFLKHYILFLLFFFFFLSIPVLYQFLYNLLLLTYWNFTDVDATFLPELPMQILLLSTVSISRKHKYLFNCFTIRAILHLTGVFVIFEMVVLLSAKSILLKCYKFIFF